MHVACRVDMSLAPPAPFFDRSCIPIYVPSPRSHDGSKWMNSRTWFWRKPCGGAHFGMHCNTCRQSPELYSLVLTGAVHQVTNAGPSPRALFGAKGWDSHACCAPRGGSHIGARHCSSDIRAATAVSTPRAQQGSKWMNSCACCRPCGGAHCGMHWQVGPIGTGP